MTCIWNDFECQRACNHNWTASFTSLVLNVFSFFCSSQFYYVNVPSDLGEKCRQTVMQYLGSGLEKEKSIPTLIFKVYGANSPAELQVEMKFLQNAHFLTIFVHRRGANNNLLKVLGENCPFLQVKK